MVNSNLPILGAVTSESESGNRLRMDSCNPIRAVPSVEFHYRHVLVVEVSKMECG